MKQKKVCVNFFKILPFNKNQTFNSRDRQGAQGDGSGEPEAAKRPATSEPADDPAGAGGAVGAEDGAAGARGGHGEGGEGEGAAADGADVGEAGGYTQLQPGEGGDAGQVRGGEDGAERGNGGHDTGWQDCFI